MSRVYIYTRVSTSDQADALAQQDRTAIAYTDYVCTKYPEITERIGPLKDKASAYKIPFHKRPNGRFICGALVRGDHVVVARLDRAFRMGHDFQVQMRAWEEQGVTVHFADLGIDFSTSSGRMLATIMAAVAEQYSESLSERQKLAWRERHVHGTQFPPGRKLLVKKITRPGMPSLTIANRQAIIYLRYVVTLRRRTYLRDGLPMSWGECSDHLERARVRQGDIPDYRPRFQRHEWQSGIIQILLKRLMTSELPALNSERIVKYFREGLNPFQLGRKNAGQPVGYKHPVRHRESIFDYLKATDQTLPPKKPKRWSRQFDGCQACQRTDREHISRGLCAGCYYKDNGQQTKAG